MQNNERRKFPADMYRMLYHNAGDAIFVADLEGHLIEVNQAACDYLGYSREELLRMHHEQLNSPESSGKVAGRLAQILKEGKGTFETIHVHRDGTRIPVEMHARLAEYDGQPFILTICRDITCRRQSEIEYQKIIQATGEGYWMVNARDARIIDVNDTFCEMVGYSRDELLSMRISDLEVIESPEETEAHIRKIMETGHDFFETQHRHKDGHILEFEISVSYADIRDGVIFVFVRDIGERKRQEAELRLCALVLNASTASIVVSDANNCIVSVNPAFTHITGYEPSEAMGRNPNLLSSGKQSKEFYQSMWRTLMETGHWEGEWWNRRKDGVEYAEQVNLNVLRNPDGSVYRYVKIASDITDRKRLDDQVWRLANYDAVTNLPNRRLFLDRLEQEIKKCHRSGESLALFFIDLDRFKDVNDEFGHDVGDSLLVEAAHRINSCIRSTDIVARQGGDEFIVLLTGLTESSQIETLAGNITDLMAQPFNLGDIEVNISGSIGIAMYPHDAADERALIKKADQAMYAAKREGRNRFSYA
jgi:diguanylate cyclase (GGDEF)-like protein/PAS domain S-box-containing protein